MSQPNNRQRDPSSMSSDTTMMLTLVIGAAVIGGSPWASIQLGHKIEGTAETLPSDPYVLIIGLFRGTVAWPAAGTWVAVAIAIAILALVALWMWLTKGGQKHRTRIDRAARYIGTGRDIEMDADGPFGDSLAETGWGDPLPHTEPPEGLFLDIRE